MARLLGPNGPDRFVYHLDGSAIVGNPGDSAILYLDADGETLADIAEYDPDDPETPGGSIADSTVTIDGSSQLPLFWFPNSVDTLYVSADGGALWPITAADDPRLDAVEALAAAAIPAAEKGDADGVAELDEDGFVPSAQLSLTADDIPNLSALKITTGVLGAGHLPDAAAGAKGALRLAGDLGGTAASPTVPGLSGKVSTGRILTAGAGLSGGGDLSADRTFAAVDATTLGKGIVKLAGDLAGTALLPTVPGLASKVPTTRQVIAGSGLSGGGALSGDVTLTVADLTDDNVDTISESKVTGLVSDLAAKVPTSRTVMAGAGLSGGGALSGNVTLVATDATTGAKGIVQLAGDLAGSAALPVVAASAITNAKVSASAAIAKSKLAALAIVDADVSAISTSKVTGLDAALTARALTATTISAGTGLTGGGSLAADRTLAVDGLTDAHVADGADIAQTKILDLVDDLDAKADAAVTLTAGSGLTGGGDLSADRSFVVSGLTNTHIASGAAIAKSKLAALAIGDSDVTGGIATSKISGLDTALSGKQPLATLTTKGDLYAATASATVARVAAGSNGQVLQAQSGQAAGLQWVSLSTSDVSGAESTTGSQTKADDAQAAAIAASVSKTGGGKETLATNATATGAVTVNLASGNVHKLTLTGNVTLTLSGSTASVACAVSLYLLQDGTGSRIVTWPASVKWPGGVAPTLSTGAAKIDLVTLETIDNGTTWYGSLAGADFR